MSKSSTVSDLIKADMKEWGQRFSDYKKSSSLSTYELRYSYPLKAKQYRRDKVLKRLIDLNIKFATKSLISEQEKLKLKVSKQNITNSPHKVQVASVVGVKIVQDYYKI